MGHGLQRSLACSPLGAGCPWAPRPLGCHQFHVKPGDVSPPSRGRGTVLGQPQRASRSGLVPHRGLWQRPEASTRRKQSVQGTTRVVSEQPSPQRCPRSVSRLRIAHLGLISPCVCICIWCLLLVFCFFPTHCFAFAAIESQLPFSLNCGLTLKCQAVFVLHRVLQWHSDEF